jgi:hypothetical protein
MRVHHEVDALAVIPQGSAFYWRLRESIAGCADDHHTPWRHAPAPLTCGLRAVS